nr:immunoglobulin light chain junction region [Macaca mulatta]MOX11866.1 immunoglobulin light chain junction region [Macaca mulatta]MOX12524.1 immunoglobulin light chain junction region [Macaca mulatta]MOX13626.1 immunoglobulin light chain junction region [Macaca mulatta]MOX14318.1 immunoglobulin light chain junction region [Macaca mulatta]
DYYCAVWVDTLNGPFF